MYVYIVKFTRLKRPVSSVGLERRANNANVVGSTPTLAIHFLPCRGHTKQRPLAKEETLAPSTHLTSPLIFLVY